MNNMKSQENLSPTKSTSAADMYYNENDPAGHYNSEFKITNKNVIKEVKVKQTKNSKRMGVNL